MGYRTNLPVMSDDESNMSINWCYFKNTFLRLSRKMSLLLAGNKLTSLYVFIKCLKSVSFMSEINCFPAVKRSCLKRCFQHTPHPHPGEGALKICYVFVCLDQRSGITVMILPDKWLVMGDQKCNQALIVLHSPEIFLQPWDCAAHQSLG